MGHPSPNVLFSQSFRHNRPGEHVDEVRFSEPVVITACEIVEQQTTSLCKSVSLTGVSSPLSFSVEIFVRSGGDARFKRFCHAFLYSASAPPLQDLQVAVTDHVVLRGTYHSLTLVLYGNHASNFGLVSGDHDLDSALPDLPSEASWSLEDLPQELNPQRSKFGVPNPLMYLQLIHRDKENISVIQGVLQLAGQIGWAPLDTKSLHKIVKSLVSAAACVRFSESRCASAPCLDILSMPTKLTIVEESERQKGLNLLLDVKKELQELQAQLEEKEEDKFVDESRSLKAAEDVEKDNLSMKPESSDLVLGLILRWIQGSSQLSDLQRPALFPVEEMIGGLAAAQLLCTDAEECYRFVSAHGLDLLVDVLQHGIGNVSATTLLALGVVECISRYAFGCEALLGWWSPDNSPSRENWESWRFSAGYSILVKFLMQPQQRPVVQLAGGVLHRLRAYELTAAIQTAVDILIEEPVSIVTSSCEGENCEAKSVSRVTLLIDQLLGLLRIREISGNQGPFTRFSHWLALDGEDVGTLLRPCATYGATASTRNMSGSQDIDPFLLSVLQERRLLPMLTALVSAPRLRSCQLEATNACIELVGVIETLLLSLLSCRSGLLFLAQDIEVSVALLACFQRLQDLHDKDLAPLRHAVALSSAGFLCHPQDIGGMLQTCLSVMSAMDRLLGASGQPEEFLWALWQLSTISRLQSGRQALLMLTLFPEVMSLLARALHPDPDNPTVLTFGEPWHRAAVHFVADVLQVVVGDAAAPTVAAWAPHAMTLHRALLACMAHTDGSAASSAGGYEEKDGACSGLLEWLDSAVVYHKKGAVGLLKYTSGILAGGSLIPQNSVGLLPVDSVDIDANAGDQAAINDNANVASPYQGKWNGIEASSSPFSVTSTVQMTVAFRILALVSSYPGVAAVLYGEGAMAVVNSILDHCSTALQSSSSAYDATMDEEDIEFDRTGEDFGDHGKEHLLLGLLLPTILFLLSLLQNVQAAVHNYQNTRLVDVLLLLHQQMSSRIATYISVPPYAWSGIAQDFVAVKQVLASVLACWPIFGWTPSLFPRLFGMDMSSTMQSLTLLPMEPAVTCSVLSLLADILPRESPQLCNSKSALLDMYRSLAVDSILGVQNASAVSWHTQSPHSDQLMGALVLHLDQIGEIVSHHTSTGCGVLQDMLKLFIVRLACSNLDHCATIVRLIIGQLRGQNAGSTPGSEKEDLQVEHIIQLIAGLALHPASKLVLLREGAVAVLVNACTVQSQSFSGGTSSASADVRFPGFACWVWIIKAFTALCDVNIFLTPTDRVSTQDCPTFGDCCSIVACLLNLFKVIPIGSELESVLEGFEKLSSFRLGRAAIGCVSLKIQYKAPVVEEATTDTGNLAVSNGMNTKYVDPKVEEQQSPVFLDLWQRIGSALESGQCSGLVIISVIRHFAMSALVLSAAGKSAIGVAALNCLFGLGLGTSSEDILREEKLEPVHRIATILRHYNLEGGPNTLFSKNITCLSSVSTIRIQEAHTALVAMLRIIKRAQIGKEFTEKALLVAERQSVTPSTLSRSLQRVNLRPRVNGVTALISPNLDTEFGKEIGNSDDSHLHIERDSETGVMDLRGKLVWECSNLVQDRPVLARSTTKRKTLTVIEVSRKRQSIEFSAVSTPPTDGTPSGRPLPASATPIPVLSRRDTFRQRKPNTSRPPSMHVDDYVARERSEVITSGSSPAPVQRAMPGSGRPPSVHVDEFMAKQQERQQLVIINSGMDETLSITGRNTPVDPGRKGNSGLTPGGGKMLEDDGQMISTQDKGYEQQWEEPESAAVEPSISNDSPASASAPSKAADVRSEKTTSSSSSISTATDSVHSVKTPQVADMLLLQSKVTLQTTVARNLGGVLQTQTDEVLQSITSSVVQQVHLRDVNKTVSSTSKSTGPHSIPGKKASVPFHPRTSESSPKISAPVPPTDPRASESQTSRVLQETLARPSSMFPLPGSTDSATNMNVFAPLGSDQAGSSQLSGVSLPSGSQPSSVSLLPTRETLTPKRGIDSQASVRGKGQLTSPSVHSAIPLSGVATPVAQKIYESRASSSTQQSLFTTKSHHTPPVMLMTSPMAPREDRPLQSTSASNGPAKGVVSVATDPRPRPPEMQGERTSADTSRAFVPPPPSSPWPAEVSQTRLESAMASPLAGLLPAQAPPHSSLAGHGAPGPQWPSGEVVKNVSLPRAPETPLPVHGHNAWYVDEIGVPYGMPGRSTQAPGNPPLPVGQGTPFHGSMQFPTNFASPRSSPSLQGGVVLLESLPGPGPSGSLTSPRDRILPTQGQSYNGAASLLQPPTYIPPPVPAGKPTAPHASSLPVNIPTQQQLHLHFQQQNILKLQQQQLQSRQQQQWQQQAQSQQVHQHHHQQHLLAPLPMSVQVPPPVPPPPAGQSQQRSQQQESSAILQQMLSPDAIQALLKDQNKLQELLEKHPKLISLLQERMSQAPS